MKIHHIGYLVKNINKSIETFTALGFGLLKDICLDNERKAYICFLEKDGYVLELVCPMTGSDIYPLLKKYNNTPYHICYEVENLENVIANMRQNGFLLFKEPQGAMGISDKARVAFLIHSCIGMIELVQL